MKIAIIGASGSVGTELIKQLINETKISITELILFYHTNKGYNKLLGLKCDIINEKVKKIILTENYEDLNNSDICIICAGVSVPQYINNKASTIDNRSDLYNKNQSIVLSIVAKINQYAKNSLVILVTNPVSKLMVDICSIYPKIKIVGCGVTNDTIRVKNEIGHLNAQDNNIYVIGEHNITNQSVFIDSNYVKEGICFEKQFCKKDKKQYMNNLKLIQDEFIKRKKYDDCLEFYESMPILYKSYFKHRLAHFLYKTHVSTSKSIIEIINAYNSEKVISCEVYCVKYCNFENCILGIPIKFINNNIVPQEFDYKPEIIEILEECQEKYKVQGD